MLNAVMARAYYGQLKMRMRTVEDKVSEIRRKIAAQDWDVEEKQPLSEKGTDIMLKQ